MKKIFNWINFTSIKLILIAEMYLTILLIDREWKKYHDKKKVQYFKLITKKK